MPVLDPRHPHVVFHNLSNTSTSRSALAQDFLALAAELSPNHEHGPNTSKSMPSQYCGSVDENLAMDIERITKIFCSSRCQDSSNCLPALMALFVKCCVSSAPEIAIYDSLPFSKCKLPGEMSCYAKIHQKYSVARLLVGRLLPQVPVKYPPKDTDTPSFSQSPQTSSVGSPTPIAKTAITPDSSTDRSMDMSEWLKLPVPPVSAITFQCLPVKDAPINASINRHLFAGNISVHSIALVGLAPREEIYDLLSSILYQRLAWNVQTPVLGLTYSDIDHTIQAITAWLDDEACVQGELPLVHVLHTPFSTEPAAPDKFDLAELSAALGLARIIRSLVQTDFSYSFIADDELIVWRADQQIPPVGALARRSVSEWLQGLPRSLCDYEMNDPPLLSETGTNQLSSGFPNVIPSLFSFSQGRIAFDIFVGLQEKLARRPAPSLIWLLDRDVVPEGIPPLCVYDELTSASTSEIPVPLGHLPLFDTYIHATMFNSADLHWITVGTGGASSAQSLGELRSFGPSVTPRGGRAMKALEGILPDVLLLCPMSTSCNGNPVASIVSNYQALLFLCRTSAIGDESHSVVTRANARYRLPRNDHFCRIHRSSQDEAFWVSTGPQADHAGFLNIRLELFEKCEHAPLHQQYSRMATRYQITAAVWDWHKSRTEDHMKLSPIYGECDEFVMLDALRFGRSDYQSLQQPATFLVDDEKPTRHPSWIGGPANVEPDEYVLGMSASCPHIRTSSIPVDQEPGSPAAGTQCNKEEVTTSDSPGVCSTREWSQQYSDALPITCPLLAVHYDFEPRRRPGGMARLSMALTAAAKYLTFLGVYDFPVFGLFCRDTTCVVTMAWTSPPNDDKIEQTHIVEANLRSYNMQDPVDAAALAYFLLWLNLEHAPRLAEIINGAQCRSVAAKRTRGGNTEDGWSHEEQLRSLGSLD